jgi:integrase/recombinase XerD
MTPLRQRMLEDMQIRNLAASTQRSYVEHVGRFARHFGQSPAVLGRPQIRAYQLYLTNDQRLAPATIGVAVAALRFLYTVTLHKRWSVDAAIPRPSTPQTLPVVLSPGEVVQFLDAVNAPKHRTILTACYAAGLRIRRPSGSSCRVSIASGWSCVSSKGRGGRIATSCCPRSCLRSWATGGG